MPKPKSHRDEGGWGEWQDDPHGRGPYRGRLNSRNQWEYQYQKDIQPKENPRYSDTQGGEWGQWSTWNLEVGTGRVYRGRQNNNTGKWEYEYDNDPPPTHGSGGVDMAAASMAGLSMNEDQRYVYQASRTSKGKEPERGEPSTNSIYQGNANADDYAGVDPGLLAEVQAAGEGRTGRVSARTTNPSTYAAEGSDAQQDARLNYKTEFMAVNQMARDSAEELDWRYQVEHSKMFITGSVFKVFWAEPKGSVARFPGTALKDDTLTTKYGDEVFSGFRRFIVIASGSGSSTCVPIHTYSGQGCKKSGSKPAIHGIAYAHGSKPQRLSGEDRLGYRPVCIELTASEEKLSDSSRVNFAKLVTVEHNLKVMFIGHVVPKDLQSVLNAVDDCWIKRTRGHHRGPR